MTDKDDEDDDDSSLPACTFLVHMHAGNVLPMKCTDAEYNYCPAVQFKGVTHFPKHDRSLLNKQVRSFFENRLMMKFTGTVLV